MIQTGDTCTLDELIARSLLNAAFVAVQIVDGITTAIYRVHGSQQAELWQAVPESDQNTLRFMYVIDLRQYPQYL